MKIYTVSRYGVNPFARVDTMFLPDGRSIPVITLGESGLGRKLTYIPVTLTPQSHEEWTKNGWVAVEGVTWKFNKKGYVHLFEEAAPSKGDEYLIVLLGWIGFRGCNALTDYDGNRLDSKVVLAEGIIAQGQAGRMGWGSQWLLKVRVGDRFRYKVSGRLYGEPGNLVIVCSANGPLLYEEDVYDTLQELEHWEG
jgi:hypothetical protein